jgi:pyridoxal biosynthesis lyase PdxS
MNYDKTTETAQLARKLYQAVLSLKPADVRASHQVHRMAKSLALVQMMAARSRQEKAS